MSRIYEALERAATSQDGASSTGVAPLPKRLGVDTVAASQETYAQEPDPASPHAGKAAAVYVPEPTVTQGPSTDTASPAGSLLKNIDTRLAEKIVLNDGMAFESREQYRRLASVLYDGQETTGLRVVMIGSAVAGEGKTLTAANLALTLSESYRKRVLLIDADLRRPTLHHLFTVNTAGGLTEGLEAPGASRFVVRQLSAHLSLLPAGRPTSDPMAALVSDRMRQLIAEARESYDWVIVDTPPLVLLPDAKLLAAMVDCALLVVRAESTPHELIRRAADAVGRKRVYGIVLNQAKGASTSGYKGYYRYNYYANVPDAE
jgi:capsular exopolysaccharide synthesis family protein